MLKLVQTVDGNICRGIILLLTSGCRRYCRYNAVLSTPASLGRTGASRKFSVRCQYSEVDGVMNK